MREFSDNIKQFLKDVYPNKDIYSLSKEELIEFKEELIQKRQEYSLLEAAYKTAMNAAYGASANHTFYFYNVELAGDITGECRHLTKTMWKNLEEFFHETLWQRKDLQEQFDFELDEGKHDWYRQQTVSCYSDTDSVYSTYGTLFKSMTSESQAKYDTPEKKVRFIQKFNKEFLDRQNTKWCEDIYNPRHGKNVHNFELETISQSQLILSKKKYVKALAFSKGKFFDTPKISGTGVEIIKSTTPSLCRTILTTMVKNIMFESSDMDKDAYLMYFNDMLSKYKKEFYNAPIEDISASIGIGDYKKYVIDDKNNLILGKGCPVSVHAIARHNYLASKNGEENKRVYTGKIKYYNVRLNVKGDTGFFGFPSGNYPSWATPIDYATQWEKMVIDPLNRFIEPIGLPKLDPSGTICGTLF